MTYTDGLTIADGTIFDFELGTASDLIMLNGGILTGAASAAGATFNFSDAGGFTAGTFDLINGTGATPSDLDVTNFAVGSGSVLQVTVTLSAVPEPATAVAWLGLLALATALTRRRRWDESEGTGTMALYSPSHRKRVAAPDVSVVFLRQGPGANSSRP